MAAYRRVYDSHACMLTAKNRDQLRNPTLGNRVCAAFTFTFYSARLAQIKYMHVCTQLYDKAALIGAVRPGTIHESYAQVRLLTYFLTYSRQNVNFLVLIKNLID